MNDRDEVDWQMTGLNSRELHLAEFGPLTLSDATTRDLFAGLALAGIFAGNYQTPQAQELAYDIADAMMAERARRKESNDGQA